MCTTEPCAGDATCFNCDVCGRFDISHTALQDDISDGVLQLTKYERAFLSHTVRLRFDSQIPASRVLLTTDEIDNLRRSKPELPTVAQQINILVQEVGRCVSTTGVSFSPSFNTTARIGALDVKALNRALMMAVTEGLLIRVEKSNQPFDEEFDLSFSGWKEFELLKTGKLDGDYGFLAMKFNDAALEKFAAEVIKPAVKDGLGKELVDLRDVSRAGVIDNLMREQIRDAEFVIVDLTHDNSGAYWEAGYAEGLGKPVVYICEETKFEEASTHFDTNHCTTVPWNLDSPDNFKNVIVATLRRSLNLFG